MFLQYIMYIIYVFYNNIGIGLSTERNAQISILMRIDIIT